MELRGDYDVVVVGGGIGGASLAKRLAESGASVLVLERARRFRDRVRGDVVYPWGVAEARRLGLLNAMLAGPARPLAYWRTRFAGVPPPAPRRLAEEVGDDALAFFHPELQEALFAQAGAAGATALMGATALGVERTEGLAEVRFRLGGRQRTVRARLVVGADGRGSAVSRWGGFETRRDPPRLVFAGALLRGVEVEATERPADTNQLYFHPSRGLLAMLLPIDEERTRVYAGYHLATGRRPEVGADLGAFLELCKEAEVEAGALAAASTAGPLAAFDGADRWAERPFAGGVALIGDAAAASDPSFGSGVALTLLSARLLAEAVLEEGDLGRAAVERAGERYARGFREAYGSLHRQIDWLTELYRTPGPEADELRARLRPLHEAEPWRVPDVVGLGPAGASDEAARRAFLGLDAPAR